MDNKKENTYATQSALLNWDEYFMTIAFISSLRSKDPSTKVGACIVRDDKRIVGIGYNGFPNGCEDTEFPWARSNLSNNILETKYPYVVHAEANAILNSTQSLVGCTLYVLLFPCNECAKLIIQAGIKEVIYYDNKYADSEAVKASTRMLNAAGITLRNIELNDMENLTDSLLDAIIKLKKIIKEEKEK